MKEPWYKITNVGLIDSPALLIYKDRVEENIKTFVASIDDVTRLRPHIKTHKSPEVSAMMIAKGITKFKCATIAEAEMLADAGAKDILLAYQPVGPKVNRLHQLALKFPTVRFSCLIDNHDSAVEISNEFLSGGKPIEYFIDLNVGMNRTGISAENAFALWRKIKDFRGLKIAGLHAYDGHIRDTDYLIRKQKCDQAFLEVESLVERIRAEVVHPITIVAGGSPTYSIHSRRRDVECSPGTFVYWDKGYEQILQEQNYLHAAVVLTRIISKPTSDTICIDLGHKSIAAENPLLQRVFFLNTQGLTPIGHSEEHMVLKINGEDNFRVGDVLYGVPYHVCPTIALYERSNVVENHKVTDTWLTLSRNKKITI